MTTVHVMVDHAFVASSKPKVELISLADMFVVGDHYLVIHDHNKPLNLYRYNPKDGHKSAKTVDAAVGYQDPQSGKKVILMINQAFCINHLKNHLICPMQHHLNSSHIS